MWSSPIVSLHTLNGSSATYSEKPTWKQLAITQPSVFGASSPWNHEIVPWQDVMQRRTSRTLQQLRKKTNASFWLFEHRKCDCSCYGLRVYTVCVSPRASAFLHVGLFVCVTVRERQREYCAGLCQSLLAGVDVFVSACLSPSLEVHPH